MEIRQRKSVLRVYNFYLDTSKMTLRKVVMFISLLLFIQYITHSILMELYSIIHSELSSKTYIVFPNCISKIVFLSSNSDDSDEMPHSVRSTLFAKAQFYEIP